MLLWTCHWVRPHPWGLNELPKRGSFLNLISLLELAINPKNESRRRAACCPLALTTLQALHAALHALHAVVWASLLSLLRSWLKHAVLRIHILIDAMLCTWIGVHVMWPAMHGVWPRHMLLLLLLGSVQGVCVAGGSSGLEWQWQVCLQMRYPKTLLRSVLGWREVRWREIGWGETLRSLLLPALLQQLLLPMVLLQALLLLLQHFMMLVCMQVSPWPLHSRIWLLAACLWSRAWHPAGMLVEEELCLIVSRGKGAGLWAKVLSMGCRLGGKHKPLWEWWRQVGRQ